jgi:hypothetical protein
LILIYLFIPFLEIIASRMAMSYRSQIAQVSEELPPESSLVLTLTQHHDENPEPRKVDVHLKVEPL